MSKWNKQPQRTVNFSYAKLLDSVWQGFGFLQDFADDFHNIFPSMLGYIEIKIVAVAKIKLLKIQEDFSPWFLIKTICYSTYSLPCSLTSQSPYSVNLLVEASNIRKKLYALQTGELLVEHKFLGHCLSLGETGSLKTFKRLQRVCLYWHAWCSLSFNTKVWKWGSAASYFYSSSECSP